MAVFLSPVGGAGAQFFDNSGYPLTGGKLYTYAAGTTTPETTYTTSSGNVAWTNPIVLDSAGRVSGSGEIWISDNTTYKFVLKTSTDVLIATYDDIVGINTIYASDIEYDPPFTASSVTNVENKLSQLVTLQDFGAVGNNLTDNTTAIQNASVYAPVYAPSGVYLSTAANPTMLPSSMQWGSGQIKTADGNKSAPKYAVISSAPSFLGDHQSILTAFNGDLSRCQNPISQTVLGAATLGQPTTGYVYCPEAMPNYTYVYNASGWNQSTSGNTGRTGYAAYRVKVDQYGQGDVTCYNGSVFVTGTKTGSTNFLANPAGALFGGDMNAGAAGVYLNPREIYLDDSGFDVACVGDVINFNRTNETGDKSAVWIGYRIQNIGSKAVNNIMSATGKFNAGIDFSMTYLDFGTNKAAISLRAEQRIYFNNAAIASGNLDAEWATTVFNGDFIHYSSAANAIGIVAGGNPSLQISAGSVIATQGFWLTAATPIVSAGAVGFGTSTSATATAGGVSKPASYAGYLTINISGTFYRVPYYNA